MSANANDDPAHPARDAVRDPLGAETLASAQRQALAALLPPLDGLRVVDLGCGAGWFARWARAAGAGEVLGIDHAEACLSEARARTADPGVEYRCADLERLTLAPDLFDLAFSSLAFHYVDDLARLLATLRDALTPSGRLVFSTDHPIYMAPRRPQWWRSGGRSVWTLDGYHAEGPRLGDWVTRGEVKYHRTLETTLNMLLNSGFAISQLVEWSPTADLVLDWPELARERERPMFLLLAAQRAGR